MKDIWLILLGKRDVDAIMILRRLRLLQPRPLFFIA